MKNSDPKLDRAIRRNLEYQEKIACITELMDKLKLENTYDLKEILKNLWPYLDDTISGVMGGAIFGLKDDEIRFYASQNLSSIYWHFSDFDEQSRRLLISTLQNREINDVYCWNYEEHAPAFMEGSPEKYAIIISNLCEHHNGERIFMFVIRNVEKKPFIMEEIQTIKMISRIVGMHINYLFTYDSLMLNIYNNYKSEYELYTSNN